MSTITSPFCLVGLASFRQLVLLVKTDILKDNIVFAPIIVTAESQFENVELTTDTAQFPRNSVPVSTKDKFPRYTFKALTLAGARNSRP